jgi:hypothetical protein
MGAKDDASMVGDVDDLGALCRELNMAFESREAVGGGVLDVRGRDNDLCNAGASKVAMYCECGQILRTIDDGGHVRTACCNRIILGCCGDL